MMSAISAFVKRSVQGVRVESERLREIEPDQIHFQDVIALFIRSWPYLHPMRYSFRYKFELAVKATTRMTSIFWILFLPWPAKIVADHIVPGDVSKSNHTITPFFMEPLLVLVEALEDGRIIEAGSHQALMNLAGTYASFVKLQTLEEPESP